jgi:protein-tyrosine phosphatase
MDEENVRNVQRLSDGDPDEKIYKLLAFAGSTMDVADPWYTGDFEATYRDVLAGCRGILFTEPPPAFAKAASKLSAASSKL